MIDKIKGIDFKKCYTFDFESTSREPAHVYMMSVCRLDNEDVKKVKVVLAKDLKTGKPDMEVIINFLFSFKSGTTFYAHNLTYDISFVLSYLFKEHKGEFKIEHQVILPMTKRFFTITINYKGKKIKFKDTYTLFSAPLSSVLESYTDLEKTETPLFDYWDDVDISEYVFKYSKIDALGLAIALRKRMEYGYNALTTASGAYKEFTHFMVTKFGEKNAADIIPKLPYEIEQLLRPAYRGGFTYVNPRYTMEIIKDVYKLDVNSMYPAQMYSNLMPIGQPELVSSGAVVTDKIYQLGIQVFSVESAYIKPNHCPFLAPSNNFHGSNVYLEHISADMDLDKRTFSLTLQEFELFKRSYDFVGLELKGGFLFKARNDLFKKYIDKFWEMKSSKDPVIKALGKLFLNSLYGKFAEGYEKINFELDYEDKLIYREADREIKECGYLPIAIFVTSYSRCFLIESILNIGFNNFVYCDTDSIHHLYVEDIEKRLEIHPSDIGKWDFEGKYERAYYIRAKRYMGEVLTEEGEIKLSVACAGINKNAIIKQIARLEDFKSGRQIKVDQFVRGVNGQSVKTKYIRI